MPLSKDTLVTEIRKIADAEFSGFEGFPNSLDASAERWADAAGVFFVESTMPPLNLAVPAARSAFIEAFKATASIPEQGLQALDAAFIAWAATAAPAAQLELNAQLNPTGNTPAVVTPPSGLPGFALRLAVPSADAEEAADKVASAVMDWVATGTATLGGAPLTDGGWG